MTDFKTGDRVRFLEDYNQTLEDPGRRVRAGDEGIVSRLRSDLVYVDLTKSGKSVGVFPHRLEKVQPSPKVGDRVRVTFEAVVVPHSGGGPACICNSYETGNIRETYLKNPSLTVEVLEPPVEVFKPGDTVRAKAGPRSYYTLTNEGYVSHQTGDHWRDGREYCERQFNSKRYERVDLG